MQSSFEGATKMMDNFREVLQGLTTVSLQLTAQLEDLREMVQNLHVGMKELHVGMKERGDRRQGESSWDQQWRTS